MRKQRQYREHGDNLQLRVIVLVRHALWNSVQLEINDTNCHQQYDQQKHHHCE